MNICFLSGIIVSDIKFKFIIDSKNISICYFNLELSNKSVIKVIAYNEMADFCYSKLKKENFINIEGNLNSNYEVTIKDIKI